VAGLTLLQESKYCWLPFLQIRVCVSQRLLGNCRRHRCCNLKFVSCKSFSCLFVASFLSWSAARWTWRLFINLIPVKIKSCFLPLSLVLPHWKLTAHFQYSKALLTMAMVLCGRTSYKNKNNKRTVFHIMNFKVAQGNLQVTVVLRSSWILKIHWNIV